MDRVAEKTSKKALKQNMIEYLSTKLPKFHEDLESIVQQIPEMLEKLTSKEKELQEAKAEIEQLKQHFSTQTKYIEYMGATIGTLLYKSFKIPETVDVINKTENFENFLYLSEQTLTPFFNLIIKDEEQQPLPESNLYKFASNLIGSVTNFVAHSDGLLHFFLMENYLNFVNLVFDGFALRSLGKFLKKTILVFIFNISLHEKGMSSIHLHKTVIRNVVDCLKEKDLKLIALRIIEALLNFEVTETICLNLMKIVSRKDFEEIARTAERADIEDTALNILKQIEFLTRSYK